MEDQFIPRPSNLQQLFVAIRTRNIFNYLSRLDVNTATGPDKISARILKELASVLAVPVAILCRRILYEATWPECWKTHYLIPVYKRDSVYDAKHYRGVHLTCILSKVIEKTIGNPLISFLAQHGYGDSQWGFRKHSSACDLVLVCVSKWILAFCMRLKVGVYLGDISGAFDKVFKDFLLAKLSAVGVADVFLDFLNSYLQPRIGRVAVDSVLSDVMYLVDSIFQGTVLGPSLWNIFFHDVTEPASWRGGEPAMFADDLSVFKTYPADFPNIEVVADLSKTRDDVHKWGYRNRVEFDAQKEHIVILHPMHGEGDTFKLLGCLLDVKLNMEAMVDQTVAACRPKAKALLRTRAFYDTSSLLNKFKTHVWGLIEYKNGAVLHASLTTIQKLDQVQKHFVKELRITEEMAFLDYNFAPLCLRRTIGILGFLHKRVLGLCHPAVIHLLPFSGMPSACHSKQIETHLEKVICRHSLYFKSMFGLIGVYNRLPAAVVEMNSVKAFQRTLTIAARRRCMDWDPDWMQAFSSCLELWKTLPFMEV